MRRACFVAFASVRRVEGRGRDEEEARAFDKRQKRRAIVGGTLLAVGAAGIAITPFAANSANDVPGAVAIGASVAVGSTILFLTGFGLLMRRRIVGKQAGNIEAVVGPSFVGVEGHF